MLYSMESPQRISGLTARKLLGLVIWARMGPFEGPQDPLLEIFWDWMLKVAKREPMESELREVTVECMGCILAVHPSLPPPTTFHNFVNTLKYALVPAAIPLCRAVVASLSHFMKAPWCSPTLLPNEMRTDVAGLLAATLVIPEDEEVREEAGDVVRRWFGEKESLPSPDAVLRALLRLLASPPISQHAVSGLLQLIIGNVPYTPTWTRFRRTTAATAHEAVGTADSLDTSIVAARILLDTARDGGEEALKVIAAGVTSEVDGGKAAIMIALWRDVSTGVQDGKYSFPPPGFLYHPAVFALALRCYLLETVANAAGSPRGTNVGDKVEKWVTELAGL
ncbi:hypothetical protein M427DRAFT_153298 [Gonapodya prolifera JEL478]|uniref:Uncharacterized protein n=1 Tax=Gonapodya prolifera (strain JEL478) TaxID=1344416 RepID=A0A139AMU5_GONPJ|nr:hypothetical protein M427DRAFT_153298 [Gonapodya prolifera JEL478]|eukprot:KXS18090.1 hypothetical protein M427DRAFT_153298 [Gonapodya prolifera JEL478]